MVNELSGRDKLKHTPPRPQTRISCKIDLYLYSIVQDISYMSLTYH